MLSLNRISLIGNTGDDAKVVPNGPTTISLATNVSWIDKQTQERRTRTEWHQLVIGIKPFCKVSFLKPVVRMVYGLTLH